MTDTAINPTNGLATPWSDDRVEWLKRLWTNGRTCSQIAAEIGDLTRNAVIGKVRRLGLEGRKTSIPTADRIERKRAENRRQYEKRIYPHQPKPITLSELRMQKAKRQKARLHMRPCQFMELTDKTCHWPMGEPSEPGFFFCGAVKPDGQSYCAYHHDVAHMPRDRSPRKPFQQHGWGA